MPARVRAHALHGSAGSLTERKGRRAAALALAAVPASPAAVAADSDADGAAQSTAEHLNQLLALGLGATPTKPGQELAQLAFGGSPEPGRAARADLHATLRLHDPRPPPHQRTVSNFLDGGTGGRNSASGGGTSRRRQRQDGRASARPAQRQRQVKRCLPSLFSCFRPSGSAMRDDPEAAAGSSHHSSRNHRRRKHRDDSSSGSGSRGIGRAAARGGDSSSSSSDSDGDDWLAAPHESEGLYGAAAGDGATGADAAGAPGCGGNGGGGGSAAPWRVDSLSDELLLSAGGLYEYGEMLRAVLTVERPLRRALRRAARWAVGAWAWWLGRRSFCRLGCCSCLVARRLTGVCVAIAR